MKKIITVLIAVTMLICLCACERETDKIKIDYAKLNDVKASNVSYKVYGEFDGTYVLMIDVEGANYSDSLHNLTVDGVDFHFTQIRTFDVYRNGEFCTLTEAFNRGLLTHENLLTVRSNHRADYEQLYKSYEDNALILDEVTAAYIELHPYYTADNLDITIYGDFDNTYVLQILYRATTDNLVHVETVAGISFYYNVGYTFSVYHEGEFYSLQTAYSKEWITRDNLLEMRAKHRAEHKELYIAYEEEHQN
ncbi:MAG: hypothetical protein J1F36_03160 [Clostridiales bacterium]|nr:hypothetical protein [Clostridiales bacterium]